MLHPRVLADVKQRKVVSFTTFLPESPGHRSVLPTVIHLSTDRDVDYGACNDSTTS
jgi:hypothetical protein